MKLFPKLFMSLIVVLISFGCDREVDAPLGKIENSIFVGGANAYQLNDFYSAPSAGNFLISSSIDAGANFNGSLNYVVIGGIKDTFSDSALNFGTLNIGGVSIGSSNQVYSENFSASFIGQSININLLDASNSTTEFSVDLYFPLAITSADVTVPNPLTIGSTISWNPDPNNGKGVILVLEYDQDRFYMGNGKTRQIYIDYDAGHYTFSADDLAGANQSGANNYCILSIIRGDYAMVYNVSNPAINSKVVYTISSPWFMTRIN